MPDRPLQHLSAPYNFILNAAAASIPGQLQQRVPAPRGDGRAVLFVEERRVVGGIVARQEDDDSSDNAA